jgi:hypothetical protein
VDYSECLTDKQWTKAIEEGRLEETEAGCRRKRKRKDDGGIYYDDEEDEEELVRTAVWAFWGRCKFAPFSICKSKFNGVYGDNYLP